MPGSPSTISDIFFNNPSDGWVCTYGGCIYNYDGITWELSASFSFYGDYTEGSYEIELYDIDFSSPDDGWAVGATRQYPYKPYIFHYNGENWTDVTPGDLVVDSLLSVSAISRDDVWFGGESRYVIHYDGTSFSPSILRLGGDVWRIQFLKEDFGVALTGNFLAFYDGVQWNYNPREYPICDVYTGDLQGDLHLLNVNDGRIVSASGFEPEVPTDAIAYHFDGITWESIANFNNLRENLRGVHCNRSDNVWVVSNEAIWKYDGNEWSNIPKREGIYPHCVWVTETGDVWVGCNNGTILKYKG